MPKFLAVPFLCLSMVAPAVSQEPAPNADANDRIVQFAESVLRRFDKNNDGLLQQDEWGASLLTKEADRDGNGVISREELTQRLSSGTRVAVPSAPAPRTSDRETSRSGSAAAPAVAERKPISPPANPAVNVPPVEEPAERLMIFARHAPAGNLAELLNKHFESSEKPRVRAIADQVSNSLLITAAPELLEPVTRLVEQLDRPPAMIHLEILIVEQTKREPAAVAGAPSRTMSAQAADEELRTGPAEEVLAKIERWEGQGKLSVLHRLSLSTLENQRAMVHIGHRKPVVQGVTLSSRGETRNVMDRNVGLIVAAIPRTSGEETVVTELDFEKSDIVAHPDDPPLSISAAGEKIPSTRTVTSTAKSTVTISREQAVVLADVNTNGTSEQNRLLLVVTAGVSGAAGKKRD